LQLIKEDRKLLLVLSKSDSEAARVKWVNVSDHIPNRNGKQCRERWFNHLRPDIKKGNWTKEEDKAIIEHNIKKYIRWTMIAKSLKRCDNDVKNHWNSKEFIAIHKRLSAEICSPSNDTMKMNGLLKSDIKKTTLLSDDIEAFVGKTLNVPRKKLTYVFDRAILKTKEKSIISPDRVRINTEDFDKEQGLHLTERNLQHSPTNIFNETTTTKKDNLMFCNSLINSASMMIDCDSDIIHTPKAVCFGNRTYFSPEVHPTETPDSDYSGMSTPFSSITTTECCEQVAV